MRFYTYYHKDDPAGQKFELEITGPHVKPPHWAVYIHEETREDPPPPEPVIKECPWGCEESMDEDEKEEMKPHVQSRGSRYWVECPYCEAQGPHERDGGGAIHAWNDWRKS